MGVVNSDTLDAIRTEFTTLFRETFEQQAPWWPLAAMLAPSGSSQNTYSWLGRVPSVKKWVDERVLEGLSRFNYTIVNDDWESTIEVDRNAIQDDTLGVYTPRIMELAGEAAYHPDDLIEDLLINGETQLAYDGQFFFDTDHQDAQEGAQSNIVNATGQTIAAITADFRSARARMRSFKDDRGRPYLRGSRLNLRVVCGPDLEGVFEELQKATIIAQTTNVLAGAFQLDVRSRITGNSWFVLETGRPVKPLIFQRRADWVFAALDDIKSEAAFRRKKFAYGVDARHNAGYGLWQLAVKVKV